MSYKVEVITTEHLDYNINFLWHYCMVIMALFVINLLYFKVQLDYLNLTWKTKLL